MTTPPTDSTTTTDPATDTTQTEPQFSLDEARRLAALDAAKTVPVANFNDYLTNSLRLEKYIQTGTIDPVDETTPPPTP